MSMVRGVGAGHPSLFCPAARPSHSPAGPTAAGLTGRPRRQFLRLRADLGRLLPLAVCDWEIWQPRRLISSVCPPAQLSQDTGHLVSGLGGPSLWKGRGCCRRVPPSPPPPASPVPPPRAVAPGAQVGGQCPSRAHCPDAVAA